VASGFHVGAMGASALFALTFTFLPAEDAWRWALWAGILPALLVLYVRRAVKEPEVYLASKGAPRSGGAGALFRPGLLGRTILGTLIVAASAGATVTLAIWLPAWLSGERGLSRGYTSLYAILASIGAFRVFAVISLAGIIAYMLLPLSGLYLMGAGLLVGLSMVITGIGMTPVLTELFPTSVRATGLGFCYSVGRAIGAVSPALVGLASDVVSLSWAIALGVAVNLLLVIVVATALPETAGTALSDD
jgi:hypothetical protein